MIKPILTSTILTLAILTLSGCVTTEWVAKTTTPERGGIVKYPVGSIIPAVDRSRAKDAAEEIEYYCKTSQARIVNDVILAEGQYRTNYRYVNFLCGS